MTFRGSDLLAPNSTPLERVMADLELERIDAIILDAIRGVVDPDTCPANLLPWLAASVSVDAWSDAWSVDTQRAVIKAAPEIHRLKGTRRAVRLALEAIGVAIDIVEWWEEDTPGRRGTFTVTAYSDGAGPAFDAALYAQLRQAIRGSKPKSRVGALQVGGNSDGVIYAGGSGQTLITSSSFVDPAPGAALVLDFASDFYRVDP